MKPDYADNILYWQLLQIAFRARHAITELAEKHNLSMAQMQTLGIMRPGMAMPMNIISVVLVCDASNVTGIAERLLSQGLITRTEKPEDRRVKMISLTPKGEKLRREIFDEFPDYELPELKKLPVEDREQLRRILKSVVRPD